MIRKLLVMVLALGMGGVGVACSSNGATNVCDQRAAVERSFQNLSQVNVVTDGTDALRSAVDDVKTQVDELAKVAKDQFGDQIQAMRTALGDLGSAIASLPQAGSLSEASANFASPLSEVSAAVDDLKSALANACG